MRMLIVTDRGCEAACSLEAQRIIGRRPQVSSCLLTVTATLREIAEYAYRAQVPRKVLIELVSPFEGDTPSAPPDREVLDAVHGGREMGFRANAESSDGDAQEMAGTIGAWFAKSTGIPVKLRDPDLVVVAVRIGSTTYVGVDAGGDMERREWRIMPGRRGLKPTVAAAVAVIGAGDGEVVLDPFADDGIIAIEAALLRTGTSPRTFLRSLPFQRFPALDGWKPENAAHDAKTLAYCNTLQEMKAVRTQSKLAGVERNLTSTRIAIDWADLKLDEKSVDRIVSYPLTSGRAFPPKKAERFLDDFCNQCAFLLKKGGRMTCVTDRPDELTIPAKAYKLRELERTEVSMGQRVMTIIVFGR